MAIRSEHLVAIGRRRQPVSLGNWLVRGTVFSWLMMAPPLLFLAALVGYPFCYGIFLSLQDRAVAQTGTFVGLRNFVHDAQDVVFWRVLFNTLVYTPPPPLLKMLCGPSLSP